MSWEVTVAGILKVLNGVIRLIISFNVRYSWGFLILLLGVLHKNNSHLTFWIVLKCHSRLKSTKHLIYLALLKTISHGRQDLVLYLSMGLYWLMVILLMQRNCNLRKLVQRPKFFCQESRHEMAELRLRLPKNWNDAWANLFTISLIPDVNKK